MKRIYISGPMRNVPDLNMPAFDAAADRLRAAGFAIVNPADIGRNLARTMGVPPDEIADSMYLLADLHELQNCEAMVLLPGWERSRGVAVEIALCRFLNIPIFQSIEQLLEEGAMKTCGCYHVPCAEHRCGFRAPNGQCSNRRIDDNTPACAAHEARWRELAA